MKMKGVSAQFLLEGSLYALEQCGRLLQSACILFDEIQLASSVVLAAFAREELGRSRILLNRLDKLLVSAETFSLSEIQTACENHVRKQEWAQVTRVIKGRGNDRVAQLTRIMHKSAGDDTKFLSAYEELKRIAGKFHKKRPEERHNKRMKALYVEPNESGSNWNRPSEQFNDEDSGSFLIDAIYDYSDMLSQLKEKDVPIGALIKSWSNRPEMPLAPWPKRRIGGP